MHPLLDSISFSTSSVMSEWVRTPYGTVVANIRTRVGKQSKSTELLSVTASQGVVRQSESGRRDISATDKSKYLVVEPGDVVYNTMRMWQGVSGYSDLHGVVSPAYTVLRPSKSVLDGRFLSHVMKLPSNIMLYRAMSQGLVSDTWNLKFESLAGLKFDLPPISMQRYITEILDTIDASIQVTKRIIAKRRMVLDGIRVSVFEESGDHCPVAVGDLISHHWPGEWGESHRSSNLHEALVLRSVNLNDYGIDYSRAARRFVPDAKVGVKELKDGDILVETSGGGPNVPVGRVGRFREQSGDIPYLTSNFFRAFRPKAGVNPDYLYWLLNYEYRKPSIWSCQQQTTGLINLNLDDYLKRSLTFHNDLQVSIARKLNAALGAILAEERRLRKLLDLRAGIAADLLLGRARTVTA